MGTYEYICVPIGTFCAYVHLFVILCTYEHLWVLMCTYVYFPIVQCCRSSRAISAGANARSCDAADFFEHVAGASHDITNSPK